MSKKITNKIDAVTHIPNSYLKTIISAPKSVKIELSRNCNYRCSFCQNKTLQKKGFMNKELFKKILKDLKNSNVEEIGLFYFGESFLLPWLPEAVSLTKEFNFKYIFLTTNGSLATPEKVENCMRAGLNSLKFSLNYSDKNQLSNIAQVKEDTFEKVLKNIKNAWKIREKGNYDCGLYASYIKYDDEQSQKMKEVLEDLEPFLDEIYTLPLYNQSGTIENNDWTFSAGNQGRSDNLVPPIPCFSLFTEGHINYDGTLCACCFSNKNFWFGDLKNNTFLNEWNSDFIKNLREAHLKKDLRGTPCEYCVLKSN